MSAPRQRPMEPPGVLRRLWRLLFSVYRWRCKGCGQVWESRRAPGWVLLGPPHPDQRGRRRHEVHKPDVEDGWDYGGYDDCGPIVCEARKV